MKDQDFYLTITQLSIEEYKDKGSRFMAYAYPIQNKEEVKNILLNLKKEHSKAVHFCYAYRIGIDGNSFRVSDDGEPSGSAGKPILNQIDSKQLTNILVVVVRYFGGTLLGVPGLINAYKTATALALQTIPFVQKPIEVNYELQFDYTQMNEVMMIVKQMNCNIYLQEFNLFCVLKIGIAKARLTETLYRFEDLHTILVKKY